MRIKSCQPSISGIFSRPRHPSPLAANPRPGAESTPPPSGPRILDFGLPVTRRAGAAFYSTLSHQLSTSGAAARGLTPSPVEHLKASPTRTPQDCSDAWSRNGCTVVGVVVFILVSVPSPFTARLWCVGRDKWSPPTQPQPTVPRRQINHRRLGRISAPPDSLRFERIERRQILDAAGGSSSPGKLVSGMAPDGSL